MLIDFEKQLKLGADAAKAVKVSGSFQRVIFCGVGGSAIPADIIMMLELSGLNAYVHKGYGLPHFADQGCLVFCTSWSGDTEEILSSFQAAQAMGLATAAVTRGGRLATLAAAAGVSLVQLPTDDCPARFATGYLLAALLTVLNASAIIDYSLADSAGARPAESPTFASRIGSKIPLIYSSFSWRYLARLWKINFNENSKLHAFFSYFPEAAHNEIAGFQPTWTDAYFPIVLMDRAEPPTAVAKLDKFVGWLTNQGFDHAVVELTGQNRLEKILANYNQAVALTSEWARLHGVDPLDNTTIEQFKKL